MSVIPSKKSLRKLEALNILCLVHSPEDILSQLVQDGVLVKDYISDVIRGKRQNEKVEALLVEIESAEKNGRLNLVHFEWTVLPEHRVKLTLVTPAKVREYEA